MSFIELFLLAVGLSMDAFAVSVCKGLAMKKADLKSMAVCGIWFGGFQALMPLAGFLLGSLFADIIEAADHWIAFALLGLIGIMFVMAVATSIDALAVGISLAMAGSVSIWPAVLLIGMTTFVLSAAGVKIGNLFGSRFEKKAQLAGGVILILLGVKILAEHLGLISG